MSERILGDGGMNLPFEEEPTFPDAPVPNLDDALLSAGVVCMAASYNVPGAGHCPAVIFRFTAPEGTVYPPMVLVLDPEDAPKLGKLVEDATQAAIRRSSELRDSA